MQKTPNSAALNMMSWYGWSLEGSICNTKFIKYDLIYLMNSFLKGFLVIKIFHNQRHALCFDQA